MAENNIIEQLLKGAGKVAGKGFKAARETDAKVADILKNLIAESVIAAQGRAEAAVGGFKEGVGAKKNLPSGNGTQVAEKKPDLLQDATDKEVIKIRKEQVREAAEAGMPLEEIVKQSQSIGGADRTQGISDPANKGFLKAAGVLQEQPATQVPDIPSILGGLIQQSPQVRGQVLNNIIREQQIRGEIPLQEGEREKIEIEQFNNLLTTGNKAVSAETAKLISNVNSGIEQVTLLEQAFENDPNVFKQLATPGNAQAQSIKVMTEDLSDIIGRLRSGGAINKEEEKRFLNQIPKFGFFKGRLEAAGTVKFKLQKLRKLFNDVQSLSAPRTSDMVQRIQAAKQAGFSDEEIRASLKKGRAL